MKFKVIERATGQDVTDHTYLDKFKNEYVFDIVKDDKSIHYLSNPVRYYINQSGELMAVIHREFRFMKDLIELQIDISE